MSSGVLKMDCPICYQDIADQMISTTTCNHQFCDECISAWLESHDTCPLCRSHCQIIQPVIEIQDDDDENENENINHHIIQQMIVYIDSNNQNEFETYIRELFDEQILSESNIYFYVNYLTDFLNVDGNPFRSIVNRILFNANNWRYIHINNNDLDNINYINNRMINNIEIIENYF
jgi:hypothetical protein